MSSNWLVSAVFATRQLQLIWLSQCTSLLALSRLLTANLFSWRLSLAHSLWGQLLFALQGTNKPLCSRPGDKDIIHCVTSNHGLTQKKQNKGLFLGRVGNMVIFRGFQILKILRETMTSLTFWPLYSNFSNEASQSSMFGPPSQSEAADAAAGGTIPPPSSSSSSSSPPSSSASVCPSISSSRRIVERQPRMLNFRVEYRQRTVELVLEEGSTVGEHQKHQHKSLVHTQHALPL